MSLERRKWILPFITVSIAAWPGVARAMLNGDVIADSAHPAVRKIVLRGTGICTGTFVGPRTMITAGHCVVDAMVSGSGDRARLDLTVDGRAPIAYRVHPRYLARTDDMQAFDVALLEFGPEVNSQTISISAREGQVGDSVTIVGYGVVDGVVGVKREGRNTIAQTMFGQLSLVSAGNFGGATATPGDSGGPMLNDAGELIGTTGRAAQPGFVLDGEAASMSSSVDLHAPGIFEFIQGATAELVHAGAPRAGD